MVRETELAPLRIGGVTLHLMGPSRAVALASMAFGLSSCGLVLGYGDPVELGEASDAAAGRSDDASANTPGDAPDVPFCSSLSTPATFCSSFDDANYLARWNAGALINGRRSRDTSVFASYPASFRSAIERQTEATPAATIAVDFTGFANRPLVARIQFDLRVETAGKTSGGFAIIATPLINVASGPPAYLMQLICYSIAGDPARVGVTLGERSQLSPNPTIGHALSQPLVLGRWTRLVLEVEARSLSATLGNRAKITLNETVALDEPLQVPLGNGTPMVALGIDGSDPNATDWSVAFDNVRIDIK